MFKDLRFHVAASSLYGFVWCVPTDPSKSPCFFSIPWLVMAAVHDNSVRRRWTFKIKLQTCRVLCEREWGLRVKNGKGAMPYTSRVDPVERLMMVLLKWVGSGRVGSGRVGSGRVGPGRVGPGRVGSGRVGSGRAGSGRVGSTGKPARRAVVGITVFHLFCSSALCFFAV